MAITKSVIQTGEKAAPLSYGENIQRADLIVVGEYLADGKLIVSSVLKGDQSAKGKSLSLIEPMRMGCRLQAVPAIKEVACLLQGNKQAGWSGLEIYDTPDQRSFIRCLVPIYSQKSEHARIVALAELFSGKHCTQTFEVDPSTTLKQEFAWAIKQMRDPANFAIVHQLYEDPHLSVADKLMLQNWIADTQDPRAAPMLISSLQDEYPGVVSNAAQKLVYYYPGARTDSALIEAASNLPEDVRQIVSNYLTRRGVKDHGSLKFHKAQNTPFQTASELESQGRLKEAASAYLDILQSKEDSTYIIREAAMKALRYGDQSTKEKVIKDKLAWFNHDAETCNYLEAIDDAQILREARDSRCLDALLKIMERRQSMFDKAKKIATMAISEFNAPEKRSAATSLLNQAKAGGRLDHSPDEQITFLLEYTWASNKDDYNKAAGLLANRADWFNSWKVMQPLMVGIHETDEGNFLIEKLQNSPSLPPMAIDWVIYRLGDLHEKRSAEVLLKRFQQPAYNAQTIATALESIGGTQVTKPLESIASDNKSAYQASAIEILANIEHEKSLPLLRRLFKTSGLAAKVKILAALSRFGTCDDLSLIKQSYWTSGLDTTYWRLQAASEIEMRCRCSNKATIDGKL